MRTKISRVLKSVYLRLFRIHDTPQKIALGFALGVFSGVMPGTGPIAALFLAFVFRVNRASALLGSILTNTWLSVPVFLLSVKTGSAVTGLSYDDIRNGWSALVNDFSWINLFHAALCEVVVPIVIGYLLVSLCIGALTYAAVFMIARHRKKRKESGGYI